MLKKVKLSIAPGLEVEFIDREKGLSRFLNGLREVLGNRLLFLVLRAVERPPYFYKQLRFLEIRGSASYILIL